MRYNRRQIAFDVRDVCFLKFGCAGSKIGVYVHPKILLLRTLPPGNENWICRRSKILGCQLLFGPNANYCKIGTKHPRAMKVEYSNYQKYWGANSRWVPTQIIPKVMGPLQIHKCVCVCCA